MFESVLPLPKNLSQSVLWTVAYTDQFAYPLNEAEVWQRLVRPQKGWERMAGNHDNFSTLLTRLVHAKKLVTKEGLFFLPGRQKILALHQQTKKISLQKWHQVHLFVRLVSWLPWIQSIWVTGSLAMLNAKEFQDIDFMITTQEKRLWLTRLLVTLIAFLVGKKRAPFGQESQTWCLNLWLDERHLSLPLQKQSMYTAYEVMQAKVVFERRLTAQRFWQANAWVHEFLPNWHTGQKHPREWRGAPHSLLDGVEVLCFQLQKKYMARHRTTEQVGPGYAFFHPRQTARFVEQQWQRRRKKLQ